MKKSPLWKTLTKTQKRAWSVWAKSNPILLEDFSVRYVSGGKAMSYVVRNRGIRMDDANPELQPVAHVWGQNGVLSVRDAGPFTVNAGYVGFRTETAVPEGYWFVWATPPLLSSDPDPDSQMRLVGFMPVVFMGINQLTPTIGTQYAAVHGSWDGPGVDGAWSPDRFIWLRIAEYWDGQLGPVTTFKGRIQVEL